MFPYEWMLFFELLTQQKFKFHFKRSIFNHAECESMAFYPLVIFHSFKTSIADTTADFKRSSHFKIRIIKKNNYIRDFKQDEATSHLVWSILILYNIQHTKCKATSCCFYISNKMWIICMLIAIKKVCILYASLTGILSRLPYGSIKNNIRFRYYHHVNYSIYFTCYLIVTSVLRLKM